MRSSTVADIRKEQPRSRDGSPTPETAPHFANHNIMSSSARGFLPRKRMSLFGRVPYKIRIDPKMLFFSIILLMTCVNIFMHSIVSGNKAAKNILYSKALSSFLDGPSNADTDRTLARMSAMEKKLSNRIDALEKKLDAQQFKTMAEDIKRARTEELKKRFAGLKNVDFEKQLRINARNEGGTSESKPTDAGPPSFLQQAIDSCVNAGITQGEYPTEFRPIVLRKQLRWGKNDADHITGKFLNNKLGGYLYATKLGIRTPQVKFCGAANELPQDMALFGENYVVKPLSGYSARGVNIVRNGTNILSGKQVSRDALVTSYGYGNATIVEELIESATPQFDGMATPDYKFQVYEGKSEIMWFVDRNPQQKCKNYFDVSSKTWMHLSYFKDAVLPSCTHNKHYLTSNRQGAMENAVSTLAEGMGKEWIRIDMFDSKDGPVLGEFTPFSTSGHGVGLDSCVMSYLFVAHAVHAGVDSDDLRTLDKLKRIDELKRKLNIGQMNDDLSRKQNRSTLDQKGIVTAIPEAHDWMQYDELTKCKMVMEAQRQHNISKTKT